MRDQLVQVLRRPGPAAAMLVIGVLGGLLLGVLVPGGAESSSAGQARAAAPPEAAASTVPTQSAAPARTATPVPAQPAEQVARERATVRTAIRAARATISTGDTDIAVMLDRWQTPVSISERRSFRAWSVAKTWTSLLLSELSAADRPVGWRRAMTLALRRSDNCMQRRMTLWVQTLFGGSDAAQRALTALVARSGARVSIPAVVKLADGCNGELSAAELQASALQLGTATWSIDDAVRFTWALRAGTYGPAGRLPLRLMSKPKADSAESAGAMQAPPDWGFGAAYGPGVVAYKAGWGGKTIGDKPHDFTAEQIGIVPLGDDGRWAAVAIAFHPDQDPLSNDPQDSDSPLAFQEMLGELKPALDRLG